METIQTIDHIATNPDVRNGRAYIVGTPVTVGDVVIARLYHQKGADGIAAWHGLTLPQVYAALAIVHRHARYGNLAYTVSPVPPVNSPRKPYPASH